MESTLMWYGADFAVNEVVPGPKIFTWPPSSSDESSPSGGAERTPPAPSLLFWTRASHAHVEPSALPMTIALLNDSHSP